MPGESPDFIFKICLVGEVEVGKTCLIQRYVHDKFPEKYITTIGTRVSRKSVHLKHPDNGEPLQIDLQVWDIMGQTETRRLLQDSYFFGARGIVAVFDLTRPDTMQLLGDWLERIHVVSGKLPAVFLGNKSDLVQEGEWSEEDLTAFSEPYNNSQAVLTSAKTGENVEEAFHDLAQEVLEETVHN